MNTTTVTFEVATDTEIQRLQFECARRQGIIDGAEAEIARYQGASAWYWEAFGIQAKVDAAEQRATDASAELNGLYSALATEEAKYTGWTRYYLVNNSNGHLHRDINTNSCSSCFPTTQYKWIVEASGMDEAALVEWAGERCCTVCFPTAPVDKKADKVFRSDEEIARESRDAARAEARAKKLEKAIRTDGETLRIVDFNGRTDEHLKTITATENYYAGELAWALAAELHHNEGGRNESLIAQYRSHAEQALIGLAERFETTVEAQRERLAAKVARKFKNEGLV